MRKQQYISAKDTATYPNSVGFFGHIETEFPLITIYIESFTHAVPPDDMHCLSGASALY